MKLIHPTVALIATLALSACASQVVLGTNNSPYEQNAPDVVINQQHDAIAALIVGTESVQGREKHSKKAAPKVVRKPVVAPKRAAVIRPTARPTPCNCGTTQRTPARAGQRVITRSQSNG